MLLGEVEDYDEYTMQVLEHSVSFRPLLVDKELKRKLETIQQDHWSSVVGKLAEPVPMLELLFNFLDENKLLI